MRRRNETDSSRCSARCGPRRSGTGLAAAGLARLAARSSAAAGLALTGALMAAPALPAAFPGAGAASAADPQEHSAEPPERTAAQALENPVAPTREALVAGRQRYVFLCRQCHGNRGAGDGDMAHAGGIPSDFTDDVWQYGASDGEIFTVIKEGVTADMQGYANQLSDEDIWNLVHYLKSLSR